MDFYHHQFQEASFSIHGLMPQSLGQTGKMAKEYWDMLHRMELFRPRQRDMLARLSFLQPLQYSGVNNGDFC